MQMTLTQRGAPVFPATAARYAGPDRRRGVAATLARWCEQMLDEVDHGVLLLDDSTRVLHLNYAARRELDAQHPLQVIGDRLQARHAQDVSALHEALVGAAQRGMRRLIMIGHAQQRVALAVVPLQRPDGGAAPAVQVTMGRHQVCGELSVQWFARGHGLTLAEARVLEALCEGMSPNAIASRHGVHISTVRTQIGSIREKTRADNIGSLLRQVAVLPPLVGVLRWSQAAPESSPPPMAMAA